MLSRSDELRFYEAEKRILRQFEDDKDVQDYLEYLENQDEELFIRVSDLKIEIQELAEACNEWVSVARELDLEITELKILNSQLKQELKVRTEELEDAEEELRMRTEDFNTHIRLNTYLLNENSVLTADLERLRQENLTLCASLQADRKAENKEIVNEVVALLGNNKYDDIFRYRRWRRED